MKNTRRSILMLPWLAHGHISPFFELAKRLSRRNFQIYFCSTPVNLQHIRDNILEDDQNLRPSIQLVELQLPSSFLDQLPSKFHTTKNLPPHLMPTLKAAFDESKPAFCNILKALQPDLLIYDFLQPWAPEAAAEELDISAVVFLSVGAATDSFLTHYSVKPPGVEFPFREWNFPPGEGKKMVEFLNKKANGVTDKDRYLECMRRSCNIILIKTIREIEDKYVDYLSVLVGKEMVAVGALVQEPTEKENDAEVMKWLSRKDHDSVVYVSFGSEYFPSREEMEEIANGLENSNVNFIWVVRFPGGEKINIQEALPEGFLERVEGRGLAVEGWAPQAKILQHSSVGGFVSHCGWSSTLEAMVFGVPIIAMPMHLDQPWNAKLVEEIGVGIKVPRKNGKLDREEITKVTNEVLVNGKLRKRIRELSGKLKEKGDAEMHAAAEKLRQLVEGV